MRGDPYAARVDVTPMIDWHVSYSARVVTRWAMLESTSRAGIRGSTNARRPAGLCKTRDANFSAIVNRVSQCTHLPPQRFDPFPPSKRGCHTGSRERLRIPSLGARESN